MNRDYIAAHGYLELGMYQEAWEALEALPPEERHEPHVLVVRMEIYRALKKYEAMASVAEHLTTVCPQEPGHWINLAYAQRRHLGLEAAEKTLLQALKVFPREAHIHYNLACYVCRQERLGEARTRLEEALKLDPKFKKIALNDEDLEPLWANFASSMTAS